MQGLVKCASIMLGKMKYFDRVNIMNMNSMGLLQI